VIFKAEKVLRYCRLLLWFELDLCSCGLLSNGDIYTALNIGRSQISKNDLVNSVYCVAEYDNYVIVYKNIIIIIIAHLGSKNKGDTSKNRGDWDYFKVVQNKREQYTGKTRNQGTTQNSHIGHCTHTLRKNTDVKVQ
jgi:hypothetical protein